MPNRKNSTPPNTSTSFAATAEQGTLGATVIQPKNPLDLRLAAETFADNYFEAKRGNPNTPVIGLLPEEHHTPAHLIFQYMAGLAIANRQNGVHPVMAVEQPHNLLEDFYKDLFPALKTAATQQALRTLKLKDPTRYHRLQLMAHIGLDWRRAHVTRHVMARLRLEAGIPTRMVDLARYLKDGKAYLDRSDLITSAFLEKYYKGSEVDIHSESQEGMRLRNLFMVSHAGPDMLYMIGANHATGTDVFPYAEQMHALAKANNIVPVTSYFETHELTLERINDTALAALLTDQHAMFIRGADDYSYYKTDAEIELLRAQKIFSANGLTNWPADIQSVEDVRTSAKAMQVKLGLEILAVTRDYGPKPRQQHNTP